jgi:hypothetical protein
VRDSEIRDNTIFMSTKPFFDPEAIVLKPPLRIRFSNDAPNWRAKN